jgi:hypothetical protein
MRCRTRSRRPARVRALATRSGSRSLSVRASASLIRSPARQRSSHSLRRDPRRSFRRPTRAREGPPRAAARRSADPRRETGRSAGRCLPYESSIVDGPEPSSARPLQWLHSAPACVIRFSPPLAPSRDRLDRPASARVTLVVFGAHGTPASRPLGKVLVSVRERHSVMVAVAWRHYPDPVVHPRAVVLSHAAEAAAARRRFWTQGLPVLGQSGVARLYVLQRAIATALICGDKRSATPFVPLLAQPLSPLPQLCRQSHTGPTFRGFP